MTPDLHGSITKTFTGVLLADMVEKDLVSLDDEVKSFLPELVVVPKVGNQEMTLRHLATHTAGLPFDPDNLRPRDPLNRFNDYSEKQLYASISDTHVDPNDQTPAYLYSNVGIGLLGHVLQRKAEKQFERLVVEAICDPLEMGDTRITLTDEQDSRLAKGYYFYDQIAPNSNAGCIPAYGGLRSTANDLLKFLEAHLADDESDVVSAASLASTAQYKVTGNLSVGLCWHIDKNSGVVWHGGTTPGYTSAISFQRKSGIGVVVLTNSKSVVITPLVRAILVAVQGDEAVPIPVRKRIPVDEELLESYVGSYQDKSKPFLAALQSTRAVTRDGEHLRIRGFRGEEFPVYPESETSFFCKGEDIDATFKRDEDGKVAGLELNLWGYKSELTKIK